MCNHIDDTQDDELVARAELYRPEEPEPTEAELQTLVALEKIRQQATVKVEEAYRIACRQDPAVTELMKREWVYAELGVVAIYQDVLLMDPNVVMDMTVSQVAFVFRHELAHVLLNHHAREKVFRAGITDPAMLSKAIPAFNAGADLEVNGSLIDAMIQSGLQYTGVVPGYGAFTNVPVGLTAEEYTTLILSTPELWADIAHRTGKQ